MNLPPAPSASAALSALSAVSPISEVDAGFLPECPVLPRKFSPRRDSRIGRDFSRTLDWARENQTALAAELRAHGAILLRGFPIEGAREFEGLASALGARPMPYVAGTADRRIVDGHVQTTTSMPPYFKIALHHEMAYRAEGPRALFFFCRRPSWVGGQTILADGGHVLRAIPAESVARLNARPVRLERRLASSEAWFAPLRKLSRALRMTTWQEVFKTRDPSAVEAILRAQGYAFSWGVNGRAKTLRFWTDVHPIQNHPDTGEPVWFRPLHFFHPSPRIYGAVFHGLLRLGLALLRRPFPHLRYADGEPVAQVDLEAVIDALEASEVRLKWQKGDVLWVDNRKVAHGRNRYLGPREVLVFLTA